MLSNKASFMNRETPNLTWYFSFSPVEHSSCLLSHGFKYSEKMEKNILNINNLVFSRFLKLDCASAFIE